ncbi:MAG TPA: M48 family metallopeptidase [Longimicrobiales bacterium]|nr:M48 family metallopeptidase [Longimicrobiales bacterium]
MPDDLQRERNHVILTDISSDTWEHPADRAALAALRRIPAFDEVLKTVFGLFGEKPVRLAFQANAVKVSATQFPDLHRLYVDVLRTMDSPAHYPLFVSQTPIVNAGAYGMKEPFIVLNSGAVRLLTDDDEMRSLLGHELGHILSGHVLYRTMTVLLLRLAQLGFPIVGLAARAVLIGLLEWNRKAELSSDRAGLLAVQNPEASLSSFLRLAGGGTKEETNLNEFLEQADEYRETGDVADAVFKVLNLLGMTHPFHTLRAAELRDWIEAGDYDRVLRGEYQKRGDERRPYAEDVAEAARAYREEAASFMEQFEEAARRMRDQFADAFRKR